MNAWDILSPLITDEIRALVVDRILATRKGLSRSDAKLALLLVRQINGLEVFSMAERGILMGCNKQTVTKMNQAKHFVHIVNH